MQPFARLLDRLVYTPGRNAKLKLLTDYFRDCPDPDRGFALAALTDGFELRLPVRRILLEMVAERFDAELYRLSRDYVGDTAETVALLWPDPIRPVPPPRLGDLVAELKSIDRRQLPVRLAWWLDGLDATARWALLKLLTGGLRVGVSARLARTALAAFGGVGVDDIEEIWHGQEPPYTALFAWLEGLGPRPDVTGAPVFRPLMLAHPLEDADFAGLDATAVAAEWKWDGIRVQIAAGGGRVRLYSRSGDDIGDSFPDIVGSISFEGVLDGELMVKRGETIAPFNDLQQRLNRKAPSPRLLQQYPAHVRLYDVLLVDGEDLRASPFRQRRTRLERWYAAQRPFGMDVSALVAFQGKDDLAAIWRATRGSGIEGLMLKRWDSPYLAGRPRGAWWKWKRGALTADCVLMYAQRGSGRRSSFYSDYTFGAWRPGVDGAPELVPVGKAYSGFTDAELTALDRWVRGNTTERFGPVRAVAPGLVLEIAFDAVQRSRRHKSGIAMRFPRVHRIRWDKPAAEADRLETLEGMIESP